jgi:aquaporin Z
MQAGFPSRPGVLLRAHWPEYLAEAASLAVFMVSACVFAVLLEHPASQVHQSLDSALLRRALRGLAMGLTVLALILSPWGQRSGGHMNPAMTVAFGCLGKVARWDAAFYVAAQFAGAVAGVLAAVLLLGSPVADAPVNFAATAPGPGGEAVAFAAELAISAVMMYAVLTAANTAPLAPWTPYIAGALVAVYITVEAPLSGMSINPARTLSPALWARDWTALWVYFAGPLAGMTGAALLYRLRHGSHRVFCAKLNHTNSQRCIFRCNFNALH